MNDKSAGPSTSPVHRQLGRDREYSTPGVPRSVNVAAASSPSPKGEDKGHANEACKCYKNPDELGRNLVVCIDGTSNQVGSTNTNVIKLYSRLTKDRTQLTYYNSGIGTFPKGSSWPSHVKKSIVNRWDMAVAWSLKKNVMHAYRWLSDNYQPGDLIFLFGFSRGAHQVRMVAGMINTVGLLPKGNVDQIRFAFGLYMERGTYARSRLLKKLQGKETDFNELNERCAIFKDTLSQEHATVHFIGIWDTVASSGFTGGQSIPDTMDGTISFCYGRHALSLDERRGRFLPNYFNGGVGPAHSRQEEASPLVEKERDRMRERDQIKEVWFVGSHSDVGGGRNSKGLQPSDFRPSLRWMLYESMARGLKIKPDVTGWQGSEYNPSMTKAWAILEFYPFRRLTYKDPIQTKRWPPHLSLGRRMQQGQLIHESVITYMAKYSQYTPAARNPQDLSGQALQWEDIRGLKPGTSGVFPDYIEKDADPPVIELFTALRDAARANGGVTDNHLSTLAETMLTDSHSIIDAAPAGSSELLFETLQYTAQLASSGTGGPNASRSHVVAHITEALALWSSIPEDVPKYLKETLQNWLKTADDSRRERIMTVFGRDSITDPMHGHSGRVLSVAYLGSPTSNVHYIVSGSEDNTIRLWYADTGNPAGEPLRGHTDVVRSVACSPNGTRIASGSLDKTVRIWDVVAGPLVTCTKTLMGHNDHVLSVAFSPDGRLVASGSQDKTVRIWTAEAETEAEAAVARDALEGHTGKVTSVAFSSDGSRVASGSGDKTVRIWDLATGNVVTVLKGHSDCVWSVAFSPVLETHGGSRVVTGSSDKTVRVWDVQSGKTVLGPLRGHRDNVNAVAVSRDARYIVSGSADKMIRLWSAETGKEVDTLTGHTRWISSVSFSSDGERVGSGSADKTVRIWNVRVDNGA